MDSNLTIATFTAALPKNASITVTQEIVDDINNYMSDDFQRDQYRENLLGFSSVLQTGKYKINTYLDAVRFVTYKLLGSNNVMAYSQTFPTRYQDLLDKGAPAKTISTYASAFNKGQLVQAITRQSLTPSWVLNADKFQQAINVQAEIMNDTDVSPKVRSDAANSLLTHLKAPEVQEVELSLGAESNKSIDDLRAVIKESVDLQHSQIASGTVTALDIAHSSIIPKEKVINT